MTEDDLIGKLHAIVADAAPSALLVGIGDDAAVWQPSRSRRSVITTDALVEGVHFTRTAMSASDIGHRALASNLSDIAAMGAKPVLATIAFGVSGDVDEAWILACYRGLAALAKRTTCAIAGGDIVRTPVVTISITVVGEVRASNLKTRSGMQPGDVIAVTGPLGAEPRGSCRCRRASGTCERCGRRRSAARVSHARTATRRGEVARRVASRARDDGYLRRTLDRSRAPRTRLERWSNDRVASASRCDASACRTLRRERR